MLVNLPYLEKDEKCTCNSCSYNDAQSPDFWVYKNYHIYITEEGMFDIYKMNEKKNLLSKEPIKTCSSLKEAILYVKNLKQNQK